MRAFGLTRRRRAADECRPGRSRLDRPEFGLFVRRSLPGREAEQRASRNGEASGTRVARRTRRARRRRCRGRARRPRRRRRSPARSRGWRGAGGARRPSPSRPQDRQPTPAAARLHRRRIHRTRSEAGNCVRRTRYCRTQCEACSDGARPPTPERIAVMHLLTERRRRQWLMWGDGRAWHGSRHQFGR